MASSSSGMNNNWTYDVFLSFKGSDTRVNIIPHLLNGLRKAGVNFFADMGLKKGVKIPSALSAALESSKISIVIFSPDYASSVWCLEEVAKIIECQETKGQLVLPIFWQVDPSDVREQKGLWSAAFARHEEEYESEKVQTWRSALCKAANLPGWYLDYKSFSGENSEVVELIADAVYAKSDAKPVYTELDSEPAITKLVSESVATKSNSEPATTKLDSESVAAKSNYKQATTKLDSESIAAKLNIQPNDFEFFIQQLVNEFTGLVSSFLKGNMQANVQSSSVIHQLITAGFSEKHVESVEERKKILNRKLRDVECKEEDVHSELEISKGDPANRPTKQVVNWLANVVEIKEEARSMLQELEKSKSNPLLGNRAERVIKDLRDLLKLQRPYVIHNPPVIQTNQRNNTNVGMVGGAPSP